ncbi:MAG: hypothetical protein M1479_01450 [Actinobacteria bacterium]|nr:hypothetical protein [Actinomycetota bacterium]
MDEKQRFINTLKYRAIDRIPFFEIGVWEQTMEEWIKQGMPEDAMKDNLFSQGNKYFKLEGVDWVDIETVLPYPFVEDKIIEEDERTRLYIDSSGRTRKTLKTGFVTKIFVYYNIYISFPVKDRKSFLKYKKGFEGNFDKRYPSDWEKVKKDTKKTTRPLSLLPPRVIFGYYSMLREWIGTENLSYMFYDNPLLIKECLEFLTEYILNLLNKALKEIRFDYVIIHEDLSYKTGPLISPEIFKNFFLSHYKKYVSYLKKNGIEIVIVDTDGNFEKLIPLFLDAGVDGFVPMEVAAGMHPVYIRKKYGKSFAMWGGIDKRILTRDKKEIDEEIKRISPVVEQGGYIPTIDHTVQPGVSLENFFYYLDLKKKMIGINF